MSASRSKIRNLAIFTAVVLGIGWLGRWVDVVMGRSPTEGVGILLWLVTPTVTSVLLRSIAGDGWRDFGAGPNLRGNELWYVIALLVYPVLTALTLGIGGGLGLIAFPGLTLASMGLILQTFASGALPQFVKNIFEESAWRGYLAPRLGSLGMNDYVGHILVGLIWGAWHIPYYLFFLDRGVLEDFTLLSAAAFIPVSIVVMIAWSTVYGEIRLLTGSIWPAVLMHTVEDAFLNQLFTERHVSIVPGADLLVSPVNGLISIVLFIAVGVALNRCRRARREARLDST